MNLLFSLLVVRISGAEAWGGFVYYFLWASLASFVMNWGNRDHLLREFSQNPAQASALWRESFFTRSLLILPCFVVFIAASTLPSAMLLLQWTFLLFLAQSFDVLTVYYRKFTRAFTIEIISGALLAAAVFFKLQFDLFTVYFIYLCIRILFYLILFRNEVFRAFSISIKFSLLKKSMLFFLLGLTGLIGSRIDQYCVSLMLPKEELGKYNILKSFLLYFQAAAGFIILPYVKNLYRLRDDSIDKVKNILVITGLLLSIPLIIITYAILTYFYRISFSFEIYVYSVLFVLPAFYYLTVLYKFYKVKKEMIVVLFNAAGIIILLLLSIVLIPQYKSAGALIAGVVSSWCVAILYFIYDRRYFRK